MRISRRTSGGRGEYEISESTDDGLTPHNLIDRRIILNLGHGIGVNTATVLRHAQGKFRVRMLDQAQMHLHRQLVAALLMPEAVRADEPLGGGVPVLQKARYAVEHIQITRAELSAQSALLDVGEIIVRNRTRLAEEISFSNRVSKLIRIWEERATLPSPALELIQDHETLVRSGDPIPPEAERIVADLQTDLSERATDLGILYSEHTDVLPPLIQLLDIEIPEPGIQLDEIEPEDIGLRRRTIKEWRRWAARRGAASARFRSAVRSAYHSTCLVCGKRFPSTPFNRVPGVDAAHIVPWSDYELDRTNNGICLCKLHHWAFDEGIIRIVCDQGRYAVEVPQSARDRIDPQQTGFSLDVFEAVAGVIPQARLPRLARDRPNPQLLNLLQQSLGE